MEGTPEERLRNRLTSVWSELPDDERTLLLTILARADEAEVGGFALSLSAVGLLGPDVKSKYDAAVARKAGKDQQEYLQVKMDNVLITGT